MRKPLFLIRYTQYEYWPWWLFYLPLIPYFLWRCVRAGSLMHFTACNPGIEDGGVAGESKAAILAAIPAEWKPKTLLLPAHLSAEEAFKQIHSLPLIFPLILKPNVGERGRGVQCIRHEDEWKQYFVNWQEDKIAQEYVDFPLELGIFYYRYPHQDNGVVCSIVEKEFLSVTGDGVKSLAQLVESSTRPRFQQQRLQKLYADEWNLIIPQGEKRVLERIGNHNRGTLFRNANHRINARLTSQIDRLAKSIPGFYYGRFDLRVPSYEDLYAGKNIRILELNGVTAEPGHIYDPDYRLLQAYRDMIDLWFHASCISIRLMKEGVPVSPLRKVLQQSIAARRRA